jgi:hypothetical protein
VYSADLVGWSHALISTVGKYAQGDLLVPNFDTSETDDIEVPASTDHDRWEAIACMGRTGLEPLTTNYGHVPPLSIPTKSGYPIHNSCWDILTRVCANATVPPDPQAILDLCRSFPLDWDCISWGHDYGGVKLHRKDEGRHHMYLRMERTSAEYQASEHDPCVISELRHLSLQLSSVSLASEVSWSRLLHSYRSQEGCASIIDWDLITQLEDMQRRENTISVSIKSHQDDPFAVLPVETRMDILLYLSSTDVTSIRHASPCYASTTLPESFWRSRFGPNKEFEYVTEPPPHQLGPIRWQLWYLLNKKLRSLDSSQSAVNSKRVWGLARYLCSLIYQRLYNVNILSVSALFSLGYIDAGSYGSNNWFTFSAGCNILDYQVIEPPKDLCKVLISCTSLAGNTYVSGLRFMSTLGADDDLGYFFANDNFTATWSDGRQECRYIQGLVLAVDDRGIRGLSILSRSGEPSEWIGEYEDIPKRRLAIPHSSLSEAPTTVQLIRGGFDVNLFAIEAF